MRELDTIVSEVNALLDTLPAGPKFPLTTRAGWDALLEATWSEGLMNRLTPDQIHRLRGLCAKWKQRYTELKFTSLTRPFWNS